MVRVNSIYLAPAFTTGIDEGSLDVGEGLVDLGVGLLEVLACLAVPAT